MTLADITTFIKEVGFPCTVALALLYHVMVVERREAEAIIALVRAIDEQATVLTALVNKISRLLER